MPIFFMDEALILLHWCVDYGSNPLRQDEENPGNGETAFRSRLGDQSRQVIKEKENTENEDKVESRQLVWNFGS